MTTLLRDLAETSGEQCVSIYLPLETGFEQEKRNSTRYEQAVAAALSRAPNGTREVLQARLAAVNPNDLPLHDVKTLAMFVAPDFLKTASLATPLPERVAVSHGFVLRPLASALDFERPYHLLALSVNRVAFYEGDHRGLRLRPLTGLPASMEDALGTELTDGHLQGQPIGAGTIGFHGHGSANDERSVDLERFHRAVQRALAAELKASSIPLVLATDQTHQGSFRAGLRLRQLLPIGLTGNPDHLSPEELHARAWPLIEDLVACERRETAAAFEAARNLGKAMVLLDDVVAAATVGRIRRLWVDAEARAPGRIDADAGRITTSGVAEDDDALEELTAVVLRHAGEVIVASGGTPMPAEGPVVAELRY